MKESLKKAKISKDLEKQKSIEAKNNGVKDFFEKRDKSLRGTSGLVDNASQELNEEIQVKQALYDKSLEVESFPESVEPMFNGIFLTARRNKLIENGIYLPTAAYGNGGDTDLEVDYSDTQLVLAVGCAVQQVKKGMEVVLNVDNFKRHATDSFAQKVNKEYRYEFPVKIIKGVEYIYVTERDVCYILNNNK